MPEVTFAPSAEDYTPAEMAALEGGDAGAEASRPEAGDEGPQGGESERKADHAPANDASDEELAMRMGWVPLDRFKGPKEKWRSAADFLAVNEASAPVLKERLNKLQKTYDRKFAHLERQSQRALEAQRAALEAEHREKIRAAAADGNVEEVERLLDARPTAQASPPMEVEEFVGRNPWFTQNPGMHRIAVGIEEDLAYTRPDMSLSERLEETERRMAAIYPDLVKAKSNGRQAPPIPPINGGVTLTPRKSPADKLSAEERRMGQMFVDQGAYKNLDEYAKAAEEDVFVIGRKGRG